MQFSLTEIQNEIKENAQKLLSEKVDLLELIKKVDDNTRIDNELWQLVSEQGWLGLDVPEEDGGLGFSKVDSSILSEVFGYYMPIVPIFSSGVVFKQLLLHSPSELKNKILPEIVSGSKIGSFGIYENDRYEINDENISTVAENNDNGYILNGKKSYVMFGDTSDYFAILAKSEDGFKFIMVDKDNPGVTISETTSLDQTRPMAEIILENVEVGNENFMFDIKEDENIWNKVKHISISFQAIQHMCADMLLQIESAKSIAYSSVRVDSDDIVELEMSSSMAKAYCSDVFNKVSGDNIQVHGGIGFTWEHPAHLYFKKAKSDSLIFGTAKSARNDVSRLLSL
jgi:alkylation response protein AidB-like acyl-CoA dehydrogenase